MCSKDSLKEEIINRLHTLWSTIFSSKFKKYRNEVFVCSNETRDSMFRIKNPFKDKNDNIEFSNLNLNSGNLAEYWEEISKNLKDYY
jgi:hypothetical protein